MESLDALGAELRRANERGEPDDHTTYYAAALAALERLVAKNGSVTTGALAQRFEEWRSAYLNTPHGRPGSGIDLRNEGRLNLVVREWARRAQSQSFLDTRVGLSGDGGTLAN